MMKPMPFELSDLYDERVAARIRIALLQEDSSDQAVIDQAREHLTTLSYRIQRLESARAAARNVGRKAGSRSTSSASAA
jgi:BMFP domain-containing protein YqiC